MNERFQSKNEMKKEYPGELNKEQIEAIFEYAIKPKLFDGIYAPLLSPKNVIFVGGQPGSGKSVRERFFTKIIDNNEPNTTVEINGDDYRAFHPYYWELLAQDDSVAASKIDKDNAQFINRVITESINVGCHALIEGTFRNPDTVINTASQYREVGYTSKAVLIAVHPLLSRLGIMQRYVEQKRLSPFGRYTQRKSHEMALNGIPETISNIISGGHVDNILIIERDGTKLFEKELNISQTERDIASQEALKIIANKYNTINNDEISFAKEQIQAINHALKLITIPDSIQQNWMELQSDIENI